MNHTLRNARSLSLESLESRHLLASDSPAADVASLDLETLASITVTPDLPSGQRVGTTIHWSITGGTPDERYRFGVKRMFGEAQIISDFSTSTEFEWTPMEVGNYVVVVTVEDVVTNLVSSTGSTYQILPVPGSVATPVVTATANPLIAIYSAPASAAIGQQMRVLFFDVSDPAGTLQFTNALPTHQSATENFYIAGMRPSSTYRMHHQILDAAGNHVALGPARFFDTGTIPPSVLFPPQAILDPVDANSSSESILLHSTIIGNQNENPPIPFFPYAVNTTGEVVWYYNAPGINITRPSGHGTFYETTGTIANSQSLREFDLAGNTVRETNVERVNRQLTDMGQDTINDFHHEIRQLPNGHIAVLATVEKILNDVQGPGPVDILGDMVVVLDQNLQVVWTWNGFDHLDVTRAAILGETCLDTGTPGCPPVLLDTVANDWMHTNAITYDETDGSLLISIRHQDWVVKLNYGDGLGDGSIIWRLGPGGDFTINSPDPFPFFSHQHDPNFGPNGELIIYDNGNTKCETGGTCLSRGQVYQLDEVNMVASHIINTELPEYAVAVGSAQALANGNYYFNSGFGGGFGVPLARQHELLPDGSTTFTLETEMQMYRSYRLSSLYVVPAEWRHLPASTLQMLANADATNRQALRAALDAKRDRVAFSMMAARARTTDAVFEIAPKTHVKSLRDGFTSSAFQRTRQNFQPDVAVVDDGLDPPVHQSDDAFGSSFDALAELWIGT